ncbi:XamI family restriction endonuclease [Caballeronia sp. AZ7_KS35]|uniref:XamI family restriction endonuclease n=1 Tax=Caballeronia sp. AZ7_KS35 TaxID=2921762 RepID=UPI0020282962|nr:XamI family restriction endonuclease [Caballeronia sp. AZ7_KS35]
MSAIAPPRWTDQELVAGVNEAKTRFRKERLDEPLEQWKVVFDENKAQFQRLFDHYGMANPASLTPAQIGDLFKEKLDGALRYLAGPPISEDDLKVIADVPSLNPTRIAANADAATKVLQTIVQALDPERFPWVAAGRHPTTAEQQAAILASAALITVQRVSTKRRHTGKSEQEAAVKRYLVDELGFKEVKTREIRTLADAPAAGEFCGECFVGSRKADVPVRLFDGRLMPIECKVSNSSTNSVKRVNNDAQVKAGIWTREFGTNQVVPAAVLTGVFKVHNLQQAQTGGLTIFWAHELAEMGKFIQSTR